MVTRIPLSGTTKRSTRSGVFPPTIWQTQMAEMVKSFMRGESVYVEYVKDARRIGSIALIKSIENLETIVNGPRNYYYGNTDRTPIDEADPDLLDPTNISYISARLKWQGRSNSTNPYGDDLVWLKDYEGPTEWVYKDVEQVQVPAYDRLNREIKVGDFICYILHHFGTSGASTQFGKVTKISINGDVYAKNIKLGPKEQQAEKKINDNATIVVMSDDLMSQLTMARLSIL